MKMFFSKTPLIFKVLATVILVIVLIVYIKKDYVSFREFLRNNPVSRNLIDQREKVKAKAMIVTINQYRPDLSLWKDFLVTGAIPDKRFLKDSVTYYDTISRYAPQIAEAFHLSGVCYYMLNEKEQALIQQQRAVVLEPRFFWGWYNLGVMLYRDGQYLKSAQALSQALKSPPQAVIKIIGASRLYEEMIRASQTAELLTNERIQNGYRDAGRLLEANLRRLQGQYPLPDEVLDLKLKVF